MHVYCITNLANNKIYIGQHSGKNLEAYLRHNYCKALSGKRGKTYLYNAFRKYEEHNFSIRSLVQLPEMDKDLARQQLDALEIFFIRVLDSRNDEIGYNLTAGGGGQLGRRYKHTEEHKEYMAELMKGRKCMWAHKISAAQKGRKFTTEHRAKLSATVKGTKRPPRSPEHRAKIAENKRRWWAEHKDYRVSQETKEKLSRAHHGKSRNFVPDEAWSKKRSEISKRIMDSLERNPDGTIKGKCPSSKKTEPKIVF